MRGRNNKSQEQVASVLGEVSVGRAFLVYVPENQGVKESNDWETNS